MITFLQRKLMICLLLLTVSISILATSSDSNESFMATIEKHIQQLHNLNEINSPLFISFSAMPGMGKTFLAKKIESELKAIRINLDDGRSILKQHNLYPTSESEQERIDCITSYLDCLLSRLQKISKNKLIIIDDSIDRLFNSFSSLAHKYNAKLFLIRLDVNKQTAINRIQLRKNKPGGYPENIDRWYNDYLNFNKQKFNYIFNNEINNQNPPIKDLIHSISNYMSLNTIYAGTNLVNICDIIPDVVLDIRYATPNNFTGQQIYTQSQCYLLMHVAQALCNVDTELREHGYKLKIFDGYRPLHAQKKLWDVFPDPRYVSDPIKECGRHTRGTTVDLTLVHLDGSEVDMPSEFDCFEEYAHSNYQNLPEHILHNRELLKSTMQKYGFIPLPTEWWHFDFNGWQNYEPLDITFEELCSQN